MHLILVRHTRPAVPENVCYGATDLDVASTFEEEAARVIEALPPAERLVTSPLRRCRLLAERIGAARALVPVIDARLREMDFGAWGGGAVGVRPPRGAGRLGRGLPARPPPRRRERTHAARARLERARRLPAKRSLARRRDPRGDHQGRAGAERGAGRVEEQRRVWWDDPSAGRRVIHVRACSR